MGPGEEQSSTQAEVIKTNGIGCPVSKYAGELNTASLYGSPLIQELVKLATATVAFHIAKDEGIAFLPPEGDFRTMANIRELVEFSTKDFAKPHIVAFARAVLQKAAAGDVKTELDFAKLTVATYCEMQGTLAGSSSWSMPTQDEVLLSIANSSRPVTMEEIKTLGMNAEMDLTNESLK